MPAPGLPDAPALGLPLPELGVLEPALPLLPDELGPLAPELEEGGVGTEGVVGVLAEGQPINVNITPINAPVASQRTRLG